MSSEIGDTRKRRRRLQFSLRTALLGVFLLALCLGCYLYCFEPVVGEIRWVNQRNSVVWINMGRGDALMPQASFVVYPVDPSGEPKSRPIATVQVTSVLGDHLAEAAVVWSNDSDPIVPGDCIRGMNLFQRVSHSIRDSEIKSGSGGTQPSTFRPRLPPKPSLPPSDAAPGSEAR